MKLVKNYESYTEDMILESIDEYVFIISPELQKILKSIDHVISRNLLHLAYTETPKKETYLDIDHTAYDKWSFVLSNKLIDTTQKEYMLGYSEDDKKQFRFIQNSIIYNSNKIVNKIKSNIKIGRLINKLFPNLFPLNGKPGFDIESFVKEYTSVFEGDEENTKIVDGDDIIKWYDSINYIHDGGTLNNSCMRYENCSEYLKFYAINPEHVKMIILLDPTDQTKIRGRALLWKLNKLNGEETDRYFMDRIYQTKEKDYFKFIFFAKKNGYLYKQVQNGDYDAYIIDPVNGTREKMLFEVHNMEYDKNLKFPFVDTLAFYNPFDKIITNNHHVDKKDYAELDNTDGKSSIKWSNYYNNIINVKTRYFVYSNWINDYLKIEDAVKVIKKGTSYDTEYLPKDSDDYVFSNYSDSNHFKSDCTYVERYDDYISSYNLKNYFRYSNFYEEYLEIDDVVYSDFMLDFIPKNDAIKVYTDEVESNYYYTLEDDPSGDFYEYNGKYYDNSVSKEDIEKYKNLKHEDEYENS